GHVECPFKGCAARCDVYRYRERSADETRRRHAGKLYARCPEHGEIKAQEYLLEHASIWASGNAPAGTGAPEEPPPVKTSEKQAPAPVPAGPKQSGPAPEPVKKKSWLESLEEML